MKHHKKGRTLGRDRKGKVALVRSLALSLIYREKIQTTEARAKELRPFIERLITHAKKNTLASRRMLISRLGGAEAAERGASKLITKIAPKYEKRAGGYTRVVKLPSRLSDSAKLAMIEFV
jgi:large subunit ribosomal protein L17